ncbi:hypothetical protein [Streptomyces poriferorum]|uniref:ABC transmembrane type-1 domain-containing protein n=1 Tax=Streptomyces poriferorum TaxID=2798799 RepID=A0ABY9IPM1_9ACTN|nr:MULTISPECIES: hypothetical protein [unclassified Streptomyces]MDP5314815.1 hypothetical protein [Streptomyces sp. Alt4]WLQ56294.1 hypothetical protein P8A19_12955 [Streptomyces sp. Alt2]
MRIQHDVTAPPVGGSAQRVPAAPTFEVLRRNRGALAGATLRVVGWGGLAGLLLTAVIFALGWPLFTHMRNERIRYHQLEDPYLHDLTGLVQVALWTLPLFLLLLGTGSAALQAACSRAVAAKPPGPSARLRPVLAVYVLRGLIVWPLPLLVAFVADRLTGLHIDTEDQVLERGSWPYTLVEVSPVPAVFVAVVLRLALTLAPAAAASGLGPRAALRCSWAVTWTRAGAVRVLALALPLAAATAGVLRLAVQLALPLRPLVRNLLEQATGNFFAAYYAGILAPVAVGILVTAAVVLPVSCTAFAVLRVRSGDGGAVDAA